ncbi:MAG TPA: response regulator [Clostridiales bacterium]|nr:response regulator [Clostridiales bacterium]
MSTILIVDDEVQILKTMRRLFSETDYKILIAENGMDALTLLEDNPIDLIISDMKMPLMNGYQLLSTVKEKYPHIIRISLSGYADEVAMRKRVLHNIADFSIFKPWNNEKLLKNVERIFQSHYIIYSEKLTETVKKQKLLKPFPKNIQRMFDLIDNEDEDTLYSEIEQDLYLSEKLMSVTDAAIYGAMPGSVKQAAIYIGMHNLKCFLYWAAVTLPSEQKDEDKELRLLLEKHSLSTNKILLFLYEAFLHKQPPDASLFTGVLHNIGLIALLQDSKKQYIKDFDSPNEILHQLLYNEQERYGSTHQEIGAYLLSYYDMPFPVVETALYHHNPLSQAVVNSELTICVHIADFYAWKYVMGKDYINLNENVFEHINVSKEDFENRLERYMKKVLLA